MKEWEESSIREWTTQDLSVWASFRMHWAGPLSGPFLSPLAVLIQLRKWHIVHV
jgi:hypothetical protein